MARVTLWGVRDKKTPIVARLYELGVFHLDNVPADDTAVDTQGLLLEKLRERRRRVLGLIEALEWDEWRKLTDAFVENVRYNLFGNLEFMMAEIDRSLERIQSRLSRIEESRESMQNIFMKLQRTNLILAHARAFLEQERSSRGVVSIWRLSRQEQHTLVSKVNGELDFLPSGHEKPWFRYHTFELKDGSSEFKDGSSFLVTSASYEAQSSIDRIVADMEGSLWTFPEGLESVPFVPTDDEPAADGAEPDKAEPDEEPLLAAAERIKQISQVMPAQRRENKQELRRLSDQWGANLAAVYILLNERLEQLLMEASAAENEEFFSLEGWIPEDDLARTGAVLKEDFGDAVVLRSRPPDPEKDGAVPTALRNNSLFKPFELFLKLLRVPNYNAYDPSPLIGIFFPFFAGCMVGDIGYGVLILWLGWHLKQKRSEVPRDVGIILIFVAFWSIVWGALYGEFLGDTAHRLLHMRPLWVERSEAVLTVMAFSVALGGAHVCLGLLIGMIQGIRNRHRHQWMERGGNLLVILSLVTALAVLRSELSSALFSVPVTLLVFGLIFLIRGGGIGGVIESLGTIGNIISYVRIAAIGLSSAILAMVAGTFVDIFGVSILGLFMAFAIHLLNFVLAIGGSALHAARLHYVEFMGKFYEDGTLEYKPFAKRRRLYND
jgi:V/A-type H+-transporting ATPase subunit I